MLALLLLKVYIPVIAISCVCVSHDEAPSRAPMPISVNFINATTILIVWEDNIPCHLRNSHITGFSFRVDSLNQYQSVLMLNTSSQEGEQHAFNLTGLSPGIDYRISVAAVNSVGELGGYSSESTIQLPSYDGKYIS